MKLALKPGIMAITCGGFWGGGVYKVGCGYVFWEERGGIRMCKHQGLRSRCCQLQQGMCKLGGGCLGGGGTHVRGAWCQVKRAVDNSRA
jgi:hypothetical protein